MTQEAILGLISAVAVLILIFGRQQNRSRQFRLAVGGIAIAAAIIAIALIAEKF